MNLHFLKMESWRTTALLLALMLTFGTALAQAQIKVHGTVSGPDGEPLIGVSVTAKGTPAGIATDIDGQYELSVKPGATLVFSYIGYETVEKKAVAGTLDVVMQENAISLNDVVVVGYGVQKKSNVTGSISQVKAEDLENRTVSNVQSALQGKTSGVQVVTTSGAPGSAPAIRVRGYSSNVDMSPLYVVDGVRLSDISGIDPNDIQSIEVLKDAASAAIYGAQAGNGVVLVTTKKGSNGADSYGKITYDFQYTSQSLARKPKLLNSEQYIDFMTEAGIIHSLTEVYQKGWDGSTNTDWADVAFENSNMFRHNLALQGANDRGSYYLSLSYLDNDGIVRGDKDTYKRYTASINGDYNIKPWLKVGSNNQVEYYESKAVSSSGTYGNMMASVMQLDPLTPSVWAPDNLPQNMRNLLALGNTLMRDPDGNYYAISNFYDAEQVHPMILRDRTTSTTKGFNLNGSIYGDFKPFPFLTITSRLGYRLSSYHAPSYSHKFYGSSSTGNKYIGISATTGNSIYYQWENFANFNKTFANVHDVTAMIGMSFSKSTVNSTTGSFSGNDEVGDAVSKDDPYGFGDLNYGLSGATKGASGGSTDVTSLSYFGRVGYTFANRYMAQFSLRADAYDLAYLPKSNRWGVFPAFSLGWELMQENFMESARGWLNTLKLRYSWGKNGSIAALGGYAYSTDMTQNSIYPFLGGSPYGYSYGSRPATMGNEDLEWETSKQNNFGIDTRMFNGRLSFSMDYFEKKTDGLLISGVVPSLIVGGTASPMNAGNVKNSGFEFELGWRDNIGGFSYSVRANMSTLKNKVTYLHPSITRINGYTFSLNTISAFEQGYPVWHFFGYKFDHIDPETGDAVMKDITGDGMVNEDDKTDIGCAIPDFTYGITLTAAYKGFDLTVFGQGTAGNDMFMCLQMQDKLASNRLKEIFYDGRWIAGQDNSHATRPAANASMSQYLFSDAMVYDASYFKIKQIQLGYTFPQKWMRNAKISNLRIYCSLDDFFTFTKYKGMDPEASTGTGNAQGIDVGGYPISKKVVAGINLTF